MLIFKILSNNKQRLCLSSGIRNLSRSSVRFTQSEVKLENSKEFTPVYNELANAKEFTPVYKFPYIRILGLVNRLKLYQTFLTIAAIPGTVVLNQLNLLQMEAVFVATSIGLCGCLSLYGLGYLCERFIGFVYINKEENTAKVSYLDFWGRRKDEIVSISDIVPLSDLPFAPTDGLFLMFRRFSTKKTLRINLRYGVVLDKDKFNKIFIQL